MPQIQADRNLIAKMKLIPIASLIKGKSLLLIDDSIVRGTQLRDTTEYLYASGARAVHIRPACPPIMYGCPYLNFSRSTSDMDLITRRVIRKREGENDINMLETYSDPDTPEYNAMVDLILLLYVLIVWMICFKLLDLIVIRSVLIVLMVKNNTERKFPYFFKIYLIAF